MQRSSISALIVYLGVVGAMLLSIGVALAVVTGSVIQQQSADPGMTRFDRQLQSAREVREALAKPIPAPQPLPPVTASLRRPLAQVAAAKPTAKRNRVMQEARQAFAGLKPEPEHSLFGILAFGPR